MVPQPVADRSGPHAAVKRELLVRLLDGWLPGALHGTGRATYLDAYPTGASVASALRVTAEFPDLLDRHRLDVILLDGAGDLAFTAMVATIRRQITPPPGVTVQLMPGGVDGRLLPVSGLPAWSGPLLGFLDAIGSQPPDPTDVAFLLTGPRTQALLALDGRSVAVADYRQALRGTGEVACVELVGSDGRTEVVFFRAATADGLEVFKDALWAVDEYAGVCYREPRDPDHALLDISLNPHPGPLRRALLGQLTASGPRTVADLRRFAVVETVYRARDVVPVLTAMAATGVVRREPARGRVTARTLISLPG